MSKMPRSAIASGNKPKELVVKFAIPRSRSYSVESSASWGSDVACVGRGIKHRDYENKKVFYHSGEAFFKDYDEFQVEEWLLYSNEPDFATRPPPPYTPSAPHYCIPRQCKLPHPDPPFVFHNSPATFLLHWLFALLIQWNIIRPPPPRPPPQSRPIYAVPSLVRKEIVFEEYNPYMCEPSRNPAYQTNPQYTDEYFYLQDYEYVVPPTPGTNEEELRIPFTNDFSNVNIQAHTPDMLRIYRVPEDRIFSFNGDVRKQRLVGAAVRKPKDIFDTISFVRQSRHSSDLGAKDDVWMLIGSEMHIIFAILRRCVPREPSFKARVKQYIHKSLAPITPVRTYIVVLLSFILFMGGENLEPGIYTRLFR